MCSEKPTGQQISAMLSFSNNLIYKVYRKVDKNCIKTFKIGIMLSFWAFKKTLLSLHKQLVDNAFLPC